MSKEEVDAFAEQLRQDIFKKNVENLENEAATRSQTPKESPLSEESLRKGLPAFHSGPDSTRNYHSWLSLRNSPGCAFCDWKNPSLDSLSLIARDNLVENNHTFHHGFNNGARWIGAVIEKGVEMARQGYTNLELLAFFKAQGFVNKAADYLDTVGLILKAEEIKKDRISKSSVAKNNNGGQNK